MKEAATKMTTLTRRQLEILQHSLGVDKYGRGKHYRNHFCAGGDDVEVCKSLVDLGFMETFTRSYLPYYNCRVTDAGVKAMEENSPNPPKLTRSQKRYREWLQVGDCFDGSFGDWLKSQASRVKA
jgi:hypothetical protein